MNRISYKLINLNNIKNKKIEDVIEYLKYNGSMNFDSDDASGLLSLVDFIYDSNRKGFIISYEIERICKEFDILKLDNKTIVNIEIKLSNRQDKIKQIRQNYSMLFNQYPEKEIIIYCYVKENNRFFKYNKEIDNIEECTNIEMNDDLAKITNPEIPNMNINIKNVYEEPQFFLDGKYILSSAQENIKEEILKLSYEIYTIEGCGGTGKTLLALDLYNSFKEKYNICYVVPFAIEKIISNKLEIEINFEMAKYYIQKNKSYDIVIIDESQRLSKAYLDSIKASCKHLIIFCDYEQDIDGKNQLGDFIKENKNIINKMIIKQNVRNDSTFDRYARKICGLKRSTAKIKIFEKDKIEILMRDEFDNNKTNYIDYKWIRPTESKFSSNCINNCENKSCLKISSCIKSKNIIHFEIGKEYKNVLVHFCDGYYINNNRIAQRKQVCYGNLQNQIYTIISRTVEKIVFVCDEIEVYNFLQKCKIDLDK